MSHPINESYLNARYELFQDAIDAHNYELAEAYITDLENDGFPREARSLRQELLDTPVTNFVIKSPYVG